MTRNDEHTIRLKLIATLVALDVVAIVVLALFADPAVADSIIARLEGAGLVLIPALVDASREQAKRAKRSRREERDSDRPEAPL